MVQMCIFGQSLPQETINLLIKILHQVEFAGKIKKKKNPQNKHPLPDNIL